MLGMVKDEGSADLRDLVGVPVRFGSDDPSGTWRILSSEPFTPLGVSSFSSYLDISERKLNQLAGY